MSSEESEHDRALSKLRELRAARGISAIELAEASGVSRQTIYAVENGSFVPNTLVALRLAKCLNVSVEDLFRLPDDSAAPPRVRAKFVSVDGRSPGGRQLMRVVDGSTGTLAIPSSSALNFLPPTDAVSVDSSTVELSSVHLPRSSAPLLIAGCDPALSLLAEIADRYHLEITLISASSKRAIDLLAQGKVHIAGSHLLNRRTGEYNLSAVRARFPKQAPRIITFAAWETGLLSRPGERRPIRSVTDLVAPRRQFINRESGSGARAQFDSALKSAGLPASRINGYDRIAYGHLSAAHCVANQWADCCFANVAAARCYGLSFEPLHSERFDLVFTKAATAHPSTQPLLNLLASAELRNKLAVVAGYETSHTASDLSH